MRAAPHFEGQRHLLTGRHVYISRILLNLQCQLTQAMAFTASAEEGENNFLCCIHHNGHASN